MLTSNAQQYLDRCSTPLASGEARHAANIIVKGRVVATLYGTEPAELKDRARTYASAMNWHRAIVTVHR